LATPSQAFRQPGALPINSAMAEGHELDFGTPGGSARREGERRRAKREAATRERHPHLGGLLLRFQDAPASETSWDTGAAGEEALAVHLAKTCPDVMVLHDRRIPGRRTNLDHLAIAPSGVFVIDAKRYKGKIEVRKPSRGDPYLLIAGRNKTKLVEGLARQREAVSSGLMKLDPEIPVHACFCFLNPTRQAGGSGLPLFNTLTIDDFPLFYPRKLSKRLNRPGELIPPARREVAEALAQAFPQA
jgi:nuclease-like protein